MPPLFQQVLTLLTTPPGNLTYHLVLAFSLAGALQVSLNHLRRSGFPQGRRIVAGLLLLLFARLMLFLSTIWFWGSPDPNPESILGILDRTVTAISIVLIIWLWTFPKKSRPADAGAFLSGLLVFTVSLFTITWWANQGTAGTLNGTQVDILWEAISLFLVLTGVTLLSIRRPDGWGIGLVTLALLFLGHLSHLLFPLPDANFPGSVRLAQLAAYPLLFFLPQRFQFPGVEWTAKEDQVSGEPAPAFPQKEYLQSFLDLALVSSPEKTYAGLAKAISQATLADLALLVSPPDENDRMEILSGYDLIREQTLEGVTITAVEAPMLAASFIDGESFALSQDSTSADAYTLESVLNLPRAGSLLACPISGEDGAAVAVVVLLAPHSSRVWTYEDEIYLASLAPSLAGIIRRSDRASDSETTLHEAHDAARKAQSQVEQLLQHNRSLKDQVDELRQRVSVEQARAESLAALVDALQDSTAVVAPLAVETGISPDLPGTSERVSTSLTQENVRLNEELQQARQELSQARQQLADMDTRIRLAESSQTASTLPRESWEELQTIVQEIRQPVASILEYANALFVETGEFIQPAHRRQVERLMRSSERIKRLVDDLVQLISQDPAPARKTLESVPLPLLIDEVVDILSPKTSQRGVTIERVYPESLPVVQADRDVLSQVFTALVENACAATPSGGQVSLLVRLERGEDEREKVLVQISDAGEGIPRQHLSELFSHFSVAGSRVLVPGLGDPKIQLSSIKTLVEDQKGRIWADSEAGKGTTFSLLFPIETVSPFGHERGLSG